MLNEIESLENFKNLEKHMHKLCFEAAIAFGQDKKALGLFLASLIVTDPPYPRLKNMPMSLQKVLTAPHLYWFFLNNDGKVQRLYVELKQKVLKFIILKILKKYLTENKDALNKTLPAFNEFCAQQEEGFRRYFSGSDHEKELSEVLSGKHNLDFVTPLPQRRLGWESYLVSLSPLIASALAFGGASYQLVLFTKKFLPTLGITWDDLTPKDIAILKKMEAAVLSLFLVFLLVATRSITNDMFRRINGYKVFSGMNVENFVVQQQSNPILQALYPQIPTLDPIWERNSFAGDDSKMPVFLRAYVHMELTRLQQSLSVPVFCSLMLSSLYVIPPDLKDDPYSLALAILRSPDKFWLGSHISCNKQALQTLQNFVKLAIIEYLQFELKDLVLTGVNKNEYLNILRKKYEVIKAEITTPLLGQLRFNHISPVPNIIAAQKEVICASLLLCLSAYLFYHIVSKIESRLSGQTEEITNHPVFETFNRGVEFIVGYYHTILLAIPFIYGLYQKVTANLQVEFKQIKSDTTINQFIDRSVAQTHELQSVMRSMA